MGKMKQLAMELEEEQTFDEMMEEAHYYGLVENVAQHIVSSKSTDILTDIQHRVYKLYLEGSYSKKGKK